MPQGQYGQAIDLPVLHKAGTDIADTIEREISIFKSIQDTAVELSNQGMQDAAGRAAAQKVTDLNETFRALSERGVNVTQTIRNYVATMDSTQNSGAADFNKV